MAFLFLCLTLPGAFAPRRKQSRSPNGAHGLCGAVPWDATRGRLEVPVAERAREAMPDWEFYKWGPCLVGFMFWPHTLLWLTSQRWI